MLANPGVGASGGGAWGLDGWIYFDAPGGLMRVRADGGTPERLIALDSSNSEVGHAWPQALPNGKGLLYRSRRSLDPTDFDIVALDFKTKRRRVLTKGLIGRYVEPGFLIYLRSDGAVLAAPFDQNKMKLTGSAVPLFEGVMTKPFGSADIALSNGGSLVYVPGLASSAGGVAEVVYVSRAGGVTSLEPALNFNFSSSRGLSLSPDGKLLAVDVVSTGAPEIWIKQLPSGPLSRLTFDGTGSIRPRWLPDGKSVVYLTRSDSGGAAVWTKRADGSMPAKMLWQEGRLTINEVAVSSDGEWLVFRKPQNKSQDIFAVRPGRDTAAMPILTGTFSEQGFALSPDNKWLAYTSDESGQDEIFVRPFPNTNDGRWQISNRGGSAPRWSHSGRELFFESGNGDFMVAPNTPGSTFSPGEPRRLFSLASSGLFGSNIVPFYDVTPDDKDFLMVRLSAVNQAPGAGQIVMVENWRQELMSKMKAKR
jgi:eukaryotic-like serine/threonine-protein kinase